MNILYAINIILIFYSELAYSKLIQEWKMVLNNSKRNTKYDVPESGIYKIMLTGGNGGYVGDMEPSKGMTMKTDMNLVKGETLQIVIGENALYSKLGPAAGGGGGSFVFFGNRTLILAAGGGGGGNKFVKGLDAPFTTDGGTPKPNESCQDCPIGEGGFNGLGGKYPTCENCKCIQVTGGPGSGWVKTTSPPQPCSRQHVNIGKPGVGFKGGKAGLCLETNCTECDGAYGGGGGGGGCSSIESCGGGGGGFSGGGVASGNNSRSGGGGSYCHPRLRCIWEIKAKSYPQIIIMIPKNNSNIFGIFTYWKLLLIISIQFYGMIF